MRTSSANGASGKWALASRRTKGRIDPMDQSIECAACGRKFAMKPELVSKKVKCTCGNTFEAESLSEALPTAQPASATPDDSFFNNIPSSEPPGRAPAATEAADDPNDWMSSISNSGSTMTGGSAKKNNSSTKGIGGKTAFGAAGTVVAVVIFGVLFRFVAPLLLVAGNADKAEQFNQNFIAKFNELNLAIARVHDEESAKTEMPKISSIVDEIITLVHDNKDVKALKSDLSRLERKYGGDMTRAGTEFQTQMTRLSDIPEAVMVLQEPIMRFANAMDELAKSAEN
jgi:hypothetical protein